MVIKREVAYGIVQGLSEFWKCEELQDFTVTLGTAQFGCHRFLLAACSGFFRGLFRSGMKETELKCVSVEDISSETFELILETMYTGRGVLTKDNVIEIWRAANQLEITFLISECEDYVIKTISLENYVDYFKVGRFLNSQIVTELAWSFVLKNANSFFKSSDFLELPLSDVLKCIKSQDLVTSTEDDVIYAILNWLEHGFNMNEANIEKVNKEIEKEEKNGLNRETNSQESTYDAEKLFNEGNKNTSSTVDSQEKNLLELLTNARTCLASHECLNMLLSHPLVANSKQSRDLVTRALLYQLPIGKRNGQWPMSAIHRNNSTFENVALTVVQREGSSPQIDLFSFSRSKFMKSRISNFTRSERTKFTTVDNYLYALLITRNHHNENASSLTVFHLTENSWSDINLSCKIPYGHFSVVAVNEFIYILIHNSKTVLKLNPKSHSHLGMPDLPDEQPICHVTCHDQLMLVFYSESVKGVDETAVLCLNTSQNAWSRLNNLEGPAKGMTSFKDDHSTYLLQSTGDLWKLVRPQSNVIDFEHVVKLWSCDWSLHGAVTFMDELYIYGVKTETIGTDPLQRKYLPGFFSKIIYLASDSTDDSTFIPLILSRQSID